MTGLGFLVLSALYQPAKRKQNEKTFQDLSEPYVHINNAHKGNQAKPYAVHPKKLVSVDWLIQVL